MSRLAGTLAFGLLIAAEGGEVFFEGAWVSPAERERLREEREKSAPAAFGLELFAGRWMTREEKEARLRGYALRDGRWVPPDGSAAGNGGGRGPGTAGAPEKRPGTASSLDEIAKALGAKLDQYETLHFQVVGDVDRKVLREAGGVAEKGWVAFLDLFEGQGGSTPAADESFRRADGGKFGLLLLGSPERRERAESFFSERGGAAEQGWAVAQLAAGEGSSRFGALLQPLGRALLARLRSTGAPLPSWYEEGFGSLFEAKLSGDDGWKKRLRESFSRKAVRSLRHLLVLRREEMKPDEIVQATSFVEYFASRRALPRLHDAFRAKIPREGLPSERKELDAFYEGAFQSALGTGSWESVEKGWRGYAEASR